MLNLPSGPFAGLVSLWADTSSIPNSHVMLITGGLKPYARHTSSLAPSSSFADGADWIREAK